MSEHMHDTQFPKLPLYSAIGLISATLVLVLMVRVAGVGDLRTPQTAVTAERMLRFADQQDGSILVRDAADGRVVEQVAPGTNGFLRGTLRGLARERKREGIGPESAFRLTGRSDGRLLLQDPATGRLIDLGAFGPTNAAVFVRLLTEKAPGSSGNAALKIEPEPATVATLGQEQHLAASRP
jgi:putative photosynthetic complex assembly protein